jgi:hypothetical protein
LIGPWGVALEIETEEDAMMRTRSRSFSSRLQMHVHPGWWRTVALFTLLALIIAAPAAVMA